MIDSKENPKPDLDRDMKVKNKYKARCILINHLDSCYLSKLLRVTDPVEMVGKIYRIEKTRVKLKYERFQVKLIFH